jgi:hypothetical protein
MIILVPSFYRNEKICSVVCGKKGLLSLFPHGVAPAVVDKEFAKIPHSFYWIIYLTDHLEVFSYHFGLLSEGWMSRRRHTGQNGIKTFINPGISNRATSN